MINNFTREKRLKKARGSYDQIQPLRVVVVIVIVDVRADICRRHKGLYRRRAAIAGLKI